MASIIEATERIAAALERPTVEMVAAMIVALQITDPRCDQAKHGCELAWRHALEWQAEGRRRGFDV